MRAPRTRTVYLTLGLALFYWTLIFGIQLVNFWLGMSIAATTLAFISVWDAGWPIAQKDLSWKNFFIGVAAAAFLYGVFALGNMAARHLFSFAPGELSGIYHIRTQGELWAITAVLLFVTSPAEEIFWRGYIQRWSQNRFGAFFGWIVAGLIYAGVHIASGNIMLTLAALVAGLFWGLLYWATRNLFICIVSHALWTVTCFVVWPFH